MDMNLGKLWEMVRDREAWSAEVHGVAKRHNWATELICDYLKIFPLLISFLIFLLLYFIIHISLPGLPWWISGKESACQCLPV